MSFLGTSRLNTMKPFSLVPTILFATAALVAQPQYYTATATGAQETPPNASTAFGKASIVVSGTTLTVNVVTTTLATTPTAGHIHKGAVGVAGGVIFGFTQTSPTTWSFSGPITVAQIADLNAGLYYVNIHSTAFGAGEIRGQVGPATVPTTYGAGCAGTNTLTPAIGGTAFPMLGSTFSITLANAKANSQALLFLGDSNTSFAGIPLPFALGPIGMNGCTLLCSDFGLNLTSATSATGTASLGLPVPLNLALAGAQFYSQWFPIDPGANPLGIVASNGLSFKLQ